MNMKPLATACLTLCTVTALSAAEPSASPVSHDKQNATNSGTSETQAIDSYVREVEAKSSSYTRKEENLAPGQLKKITDENWSKLHMYYDGEKLKRMKLYPAAGSQKTEEFYYRDDKPVFVFLEENGAGKENHDANAKGDKYYFAKGKLLAAVGADGQLLGTSSAQTKKTAEKLKKESQAFRATMKK
jgi:hypothetical protein